MIRKTLLVAVVLVAAAPASAIARAPRLLNSEPSTTFAPRPPFMDFDETQYRGGTSNFIDGPGLTLKTWHTDPNKPIHWIRWGAKAVGKGTSFTQMCPSFRGVIQYCTQQYIALQVTVVAWRVRGGRYTRLVFKLGPASWETTPTYGLRWVNIKVKGLPGGVNAFAWCEVADRAGCSHP